MSDEFKNLKGLASLLDGIIGSIGDTSIMLIFLWILVIIGALAYPLWVAFSGM